MKPKPWHIAVMVVGLLIGAGSAARVLLAQGPPATAHVIHCVNVETGDLYRLDTEKHPVLLPARHPATGRVCLVRVNKDEQGQWVVRPRDLETLALLDQGVANAAVEPKTGRLLLEAKEPVEYVRVP